ncbi:MAG TPA: flagellar hook-length control protein FliK [Rhodocyclaceae bacterium]|nr:flagellar hook-length control protein FliK [Rhodocyclaceae bacterium]
MPGLAVAPNPVAPNVSNNAASNGNANSTNDAANSDTSFSSALQRSMKSNSNADKPAQQSHNDAKTGNKTESQDAQQSSATTASATATGQAAPPSDPLASLLPMLQGKFAQLAQNAEQTGESKEKARKTTDDSNAGSGQESLLAGLAGAMGAQQQLAQPTAITGTPNNGTTDAKSDTTSALAGQPAIIAMEDALASQAKKAGDKDAAEPGFQTLLDSAQNAQQAQHGQESRVGQTTSRTETRIETPVGHERWTQEVGDKLTWMVNKQESTATLVLNPPHMGRVEVSVTINGDQANASFISANPAVREVLEGSLPRLKEVLADAGIQLGQAQVGADSRGDSSQNPERRDNRGQNKTVTGEFVPGLASSASAQSWTKQGNGMVDTFV